MNKIYSSLYTATSFPVSFDIALLNWQKAITDFVSLKAEIDAFLLQEGSSTSQDPKKKKKLIQLRQAMTKCLLTLSRGMELHYDPIGVNELSAHCKIITTKHASITSELNQLGCNYFAINKADLLN